MPSLHRESTDSDNFHKNLYTCECIYHAAVVYQEYMHEAVIELEAQGF